MKFVGNSNGLHAPARAVVFQVEHWAPGPPELSDVH